ncbi:MAG: DUF4377 domain-containing protein, partial [Acidobacteria bacterium]|nr:DUF4377 domain-containing protein [Acidobacteriota bacterium]
MKLFTNILILAVGFVFTNGLKAVEAQNVRGDLSKVGNIEVIEIAPNRVYCDGIQKKPCLFVKREDADDFTVLFDEIENFSFIPGFKYTLKIEVEKD